MAKANNQTKPKAEAEIETAEVAAEPEVSKKFFPVVWYSRIGHYHVHFNQGSYPDGRPKPVKVISFSNHEVTIANEADDALLRAHPKFQMNFWPTSAPVPASGATYHEGVQTTKSLKDRQV